MARFQNDAEFTDLIARRQRPPTPYPDDQTGYNAWLQDERALTPPQDTAYAPPAQVPSPSAPAAPVASNNWNTGGYATPQYTAPQVGNVIGGWEATNWTDTTMQTPKYVVGRILAQYPSNTAGLQQAFAEIQRAYPGSTIVGKDSVMIPGVGTIDVGGDFGGDKERWQWLPTLDQYGNPYPSSQGPTGTGAGTATTGGGAGSTSLLPLGRTTTETDPFYTLQRDALTRLMGQNPTAVTAESPGVKGAVDAYRAEAERARRERYRTEMERLGMAGLSDSGAADASLAQGYEDMGRGVATYAANAVTQEMAAQRAEVAQALQLATQMGMTQEAQDLQRQLANLDATLRQQEFSDLLGWQMAQYQMNYPLAYMRALWGG